MRKHAGQKNSGNYPLPASATDASTGSPPRGTVHLIPDVERFADVFADWNGGFYQLSCGRFSGTVRVFAGRAVRAFQADTIESVLTRGEDRAP